MRHLPASNPSPFFFDPAFLGLEFVEPGPPDFRDSALLAVAERDNVVFTGKGTRGASPKLPAYRRPGLLPVEPKSPSSEFQILSVATLAGILHQTDIRCPQP
jgi:hypothetical protein